MTRFFLFLLSYGFIVTSSAQIILYLNYRTLGYDWDAVLFYIVRTADFAILIVSIIALVIIVFFRAPSHFPFSSG